MTIQIDNKPHKTISNRCTSRLIDLIISNKRLLEIISRVQSAKEANKGLTVEDIEEIMKSNLETLVLIGDITTNVAEEFCLLWMDSSDKDIAIVLEEIICKLGPYRFTYNSLGYSRESKVYETGKDSNFDVIFYEKENAQIYNKNKFVDISGEIEFHECKKNVCNYIPRQKDQLRTDVKNKLYFMKVVKMLVLEASFFIPTFHYNVKAQQNFLNDNGYEFINIISIKDLVCRYC